jgi:hypothetical protein
MDSSSPANSHSGPADGPAPAVGEAGQLAFMAAAFEPGAAGPPAGAIARAPRHARHLRRGPRRRPPKLYRIGELVAYSGLSRQTVHNYSAMGLLREADWTRGGHRLYDESVFERIDEIADMKARGQGLAEIREHFAGIDRQRG